MQMLCTHLQNVLKNQSNVRQRLMKPLGRTNLPVQADLHRYHLSISEVQPNAGSGLHGEDQRPSVKHVQGWSVLVLTRSDGAPVSGSWWIW